MQRRTIVIVTALVLGAVLAGAGWWFTRDTAPPPLSVDGVSADGSDSTDGSGSGAAADLDGTWTVASGPDTQAGLRIEEDRFGGLADNTAVGRTGAVTGELTVADRTITDGQFAVDLSTIEFTDDPGIPVASRSEYLRTKALETDRFPDVTFALTEPVDLDELPADGKTVTASVTGDFTLHGVTVPMTFDVDAKRIGDRVVLATSSPVSVVLADHNIEVPVIPNVSEVRDTGAFEFVVVLEHP